MIQETTSAPFAMRLIRRVGFAWQAITARLSARSTCAPVKPAHLSQRAAGGPQMALSQETTIHRRAVRSNNRKPEASAQYVRVHKILSKGC